MVRAKFQVTDITEHRYPGKTVRLQAIYDPDTPEDKKFVEATPTGSMEMLITNPKALEIFQVNQYFYLDFTPVGK